MKKLLKIVAISIITLLSFNLNSQTFTMKFKLNFGGYTIKQGKTTHYFEPVSINTQDIQYSIDSLNYARAAFMDSLEEERVSNAFTLYYKKDYSLSEFFSEFDPDEKFIKNENINLKDSAILYFNLSKQIIDSLISLRDSNGLEKITIDENNMWDWFTDTKSYITSYFKAPTMIFDSDESCNCSCYKSLVENILSNKKYKRNILSKRTKSLYVSVFNNSKKEIMIYMRFDKKFTTNQYLFILED